MVLSTSRSKAEHTIDNLDLPDHIALLQPPDLSLTNHMHHFVALDGVQSTFYGTEPLAGDDALFDKAMILPSITLFI